MVTNDVLARRMIDLEQAVYDILADEVSKFKHDELIAALRRSDLDASNLGVTVPGSGCKFCLPQYDDLRRETESEFECDLKACVMTRSYTTRSASSKTQTY